MLIVSGPRPIWANFQKGDVIAFKNDSNGGRIGPLTTRTPKSYGSSRKPENQMGRNVALQLKINVIPMAIGLWP
jgi:hypothetical protein